MGENLRRRQPAAGMAELNARHPWSHNDHFHSWIVANLPEPCRTALDVGCGRGELVAALAPHVGRVVGNDADSAMREQAARRCAGLPNVTITGEDWSDGDETYDLVTMVAVLHHLDVPEALHEVRRRLSPGGRFLAVGLAQPRSRARPRVGRRVHGHQSDHRVREASLAQQGRQCAAAAVPGPRPDTVIRRVASASREGHARSSHPSPTRVSPHNHLDQTETVRVGFTGGASSNSANNRSGARAIDDVIVYAFIVIAGLALIAFALTLLARKTQTAGSNS